MFCMILSGFLSSFCLFCSVSDRKICFSIRKPIPTSVRTTRSLVKIHNILLLPKFSIEEHPYNKPLTSCLNKFCWFIWKIKSKIGSLYKWSNLLTLFKRIKVEQNWLIRYELIMRVPVIEHSQKCFFHPISICRLIFIQPSFFLYNHLVTDHAKKGIFRQSKTAKLVSNKIFLQKLCLSKRGKDGIFSICLLSADVTVEYFNFRWWIEILKFQTMIYRLLVS